MSVGVTLYPNRILIETYNQVQAGYWIVTDQISWLPAEASDEELGKVVNKHRALCQIGLADPDKEGFKQIGKQNAKATGIKNIKAKYQKAKHVSVSEVSKGIAIAPTAKDTRGFAFIGGELLCDKNCKDEILGRAIREGLNKCK